MMKLLLVDGHPSFGVGFAHALSHAGVGIQVDTSLTIDDGLHQADCGGYNIVLIDYRLQQGDGIEGLRRFGARFTLITQVLISGNDDPALAARARAAGASGFLGKSLPIDALLSELSAIARGEVVFGPVSALRPAPAGP